MCECVVPLSVLWHSGSGDANVSLFTITDARHSLFDIAAVAVSISLARARVEYNEKLETVLCNRRRRSPARERSLAVCVLQHSSRRDTMTQLRSALLICVPCRDGLAFRRTSRQRRFSLSVLPATVLKLYDFIMQ